VEKHSLPKEVFTAKTKFSLQKRSFSMLRHELKILGKNDLRSRQARRCIFKRRPHLNGESLCVRQKTDSSFGVHSPVQMRQILTILTTCYITGSARVVVRTLKVQSTVQGQLHITHRDISMKLENWKWNIITSLKHQTFYFGDLLPELVDSGHQRG
jgi:hypothetical protein